MLNTLIEINKYNKYNYITLKAKDEIRSLVQSKKATLVTHKGRAKCWEYMCDIKMNNMLIEGYVSCNRCFEIFTYTEKTGNNHLNRHKCSQLKSKTMPLQNWDRSAKNLNTEEKEKILNAELDLVASTNSSFRFVDNHAFLKYTQAVIDAAAKYPGITARELVHGRKAVKSQLTKTKLKIDQKLLDIARKHKNLISMTSDMWSDNINKNSFLEISIFWVDEDYIIKNCLLSMDQFDMRSTAENIKIHLEKVLSDYGIEKSSFITTDCGSNIRKATAEMIRNDCACHRLNTALERGFQNACEINDDLNFNHNSLIKLCSYVRKTTDIQNKLPSKIKGGCATRAWRGLVSQYNSVFERYDPLLPIMQIKGKHQLLFFVNKDIVKEVLDVMQPFSILFDKFETNSVPSLNTVVPSFYLVMEHLKMKTNDTDCVKTLKLSLKDEIEEKFAPMADLPVENSSNIFWQATLLDSSLKSLSFHSDTAQRKNVIDTIKKAIVKAATALYHKENPLIVHNDPEDANNDNRCFDIFDQFRVQKQPKIDIELQASAGLENYMAMSTTATNNPLKFF